MVDPPGLTITASGIAEVHIQVFHVRFPKRIRCLKDGQTDWQVDGHMAGQIAGQIDGQIAQTSLLDRLSDGQIAE